MHRVNTFICRAIEEGLRRHKVAKTVADYVGPEVGLGGHREAFDRGIGEAWERLLPVWPELAAHAERWCREQAARPDLATALEQFYRNWLSYAA